MNPYTETITHSAGIYAKRNPLTGNWLCFGQRGSNAPYVMADVSGARAMLKTIAHFNATGKVKAF